jgi:hypothetical protein
MKDSCFSMPGDNADWDFEGDEGDGPEIMPADGFDWPE